MFFYVLLLLAALCLLIPGCRWLGKRLRLWRCITSLCKEKQYRLHHTKIWWFLGGRDGKQADFMIETDDALFSVKLFGVLGQHTVLVLWPDGRYSLRRIVSLLLQVKIPLDTAPRSFPKYNAYDNAADTPKEQRTVLLLNPAPMNICFKDRDGKERQAYPSDSVCGMNGMNLRELIAHLQ